MDPSGRGAIVRIYGFGSFSNLLKSFGRILRTTFWPMTTLLFLSPTIWMTATLEFKLSLFTSILRYSLFQNVGLMIRTSLASNHIWWQNYLIELTSCPIRVHCVLLWENMFDFSLEVPWFNHDFYCCSSVAIIFYITDTLLSIICVIIWEYANKVRFAFI